MAPAEPKKLFDQKLKQEQIGIRPEYIFLYGIRVRSTELYVKPLYQTTRAVRFLRSFLNLFIFN